MPNFLWGFSIPQSTSGVTPQVVALPRLGPPGSVSSDYNTPGTTVPTTMINVVRDYYWTYSPVGDSARAEVPRIILTERKLRTNALVSQLKYSLGQAYSGGTQTIENIRQFANQATGGETPFSKFLLNLEQNPAGAVSSLFSSTPTTDQADPNRGQTANNDTNPNYQQILRNSGALVRDAVVSALQDDNNPTVNNSTWLAPYKNLYLSDPTGWVYVLPYFDNNLASQANGFSDTGSTGTLPDFTKPFLDIANGTAGLIASLNNPTQITYIERTKFYNYPPDGEDITVEFPLINTGDVSYDDVVKNWQFLFLLLYQNRPGKTSANTVDQPVIYQVEVPGIKFFPFCYIQSLNIEFMGSRRELNIEIPTTTTTSTTTTTPNATTSSNAGGTTTQSVDTVQDTQTIAAIIPDAYKVRISLRSMIANSKNFMQHMIGPHQLVETGTVTTPVAVAAVQNNAAVQPGALIA